MGGGGLVQFIRADGSLVLSCSFGGSKRLELGALSPKNQSKSTTCSSDLHCRWFSIISKCWNLAKHIGKLILEQHVGKVWGEAHSRRWVFLELSTVNSIEATLPHSPQPHVVTLLGIILQNIQHFEKMYLPHAPLLLLLSLPASLHLANTHTGALQNAHNHTCTTPLKTGPPLPSP